MAAAVAASMLLTAGCGAAGTTPQGNSAPQRGASPSASGGADTKGNTAEVCKATTDISRDLLKGIFSGLMPSAGPTVEPAVAARDGLVKLSKQVRAQAAKAADPALRAALERTATAADEMAKQPDPSELDSPAFDKATKEVEELCKDSLTPTVPPGTPPTKVGPAGSACPLPVSFDVVALWKPKAIDPNENAELLDFFSHGPFKVACEIDAKPAGDVGFLRVFLAADRRGTPRSHLEAFVAAESPEARKKGNVEIRTTRYTNGTVGGQPASEVTYETYNKTMDHKSKYSAFALNTPRGAVVVKLAPFGDDEHPEILPAFELAKRTLAVNP